MMTLTENVEKNTDNRKYTLITTRNQVIKVY